MTLNFRDLFQPYLSAIRQQVVTAAGDWTVKGFIDINQRIYTITLDTKVLSKVLELLMYPVITRFAAENGYDVFLAKAQNQYPDISLVSKSDPSECYALDIKSTYRNGYDASGQARISGMTLGTFGGYFRTRDRPVSSTFAYNRYLQHYVLGVVYSRVEGVDERQVYGIEQLADIPSVVRNFDFFLQEKYRIASDVPGSGNTKNIGSTRYLDRLLNGSGVFADLGVEVFDDYWMNYRTREMALTEGFTQPPYASLKGYREFKERGAQILNTLPQDLPSEAEDSDIPPNSTD